MRKSIYLVILSVLLCTSTLSADRPTATTYYVDDSNGNDNWDGSSPVYVSGNTGPFKTIGKGLTRADENDTIIVADGIYYGRGNLDLDFYHNSVTLKSANGPESCILNFYGSSYSWEFLTRGEILIYGFTFKGLTNGIVKGYLENITEFYNCIFENNILENNNSLIAHNGQGSLKLNNCIFRDNTVGRSSIIKTSGFASLEIVDCEFTENVSVYDYSLISCIGDCNAVIINTQVDKNWNYNGNRIWAIHCGERTNVKISDCSITNNASDYYVSGIVCENESNVVVSGCNISGNSSKKNNHGIFVTSCSTSNLKVENCIISDNNIDSSFESYGIYAEECNLLEVTNCLILNHFRSGIEIRSCLGFKKVKNCTVVNNTNRYIGTGIIGYHFVTVENCIVKGFGKQLSGNDLVVSYSDISDNTDHIWPGVGNINADPLFADPNNGDYHLLSEAGRWNPANQRWIRDDVSSPCIDAGDPADWIGDEPAGNGGRINMGYFGGTFQASKTDCCNGVLPGDVNRDCFVNFVDFALMSSNWLDSNVEP